MIKICNERKRIIDSTSHVIVLGGPGSGKTTIALLKASKEVHHLLAGQKILFLGFAKATVKRVLEAAKETIDEENSKLIEMSTYHSFFLRILQSHGYLLNKNYPFKVLGAAERAIRVAHLEKKQQKSEYERLFVENGELVFDIFSVKVKEIISKSKKIRELISDVYPVIIVDEFQDTDSEQWEIIKLLGEKSRVIALADPEQQIYTFRGAHKRRVEHFKEYFEYGEFDFGYENYRSSKTDINKFGNDLVAGINKKETYEEVDIIPYGWCNNLCKNKRKCQGLCHLAVAVSTGIGRLKGAINWSLAILFPSKKQVLQAYKYFFSGKDETCPYTLDVVIDSEGPELAGFLFAKLLEKFASPEEIEKQIIEHLIDYLKGGKGDKKPSEKDLELSDALKKILEDGRVIGKKRKKLIEEVRKVSDQIFKCELTGSPHIDWMSNLIFFERLESEILIKIREDTKYIKLLLNRDSKLAGMLGESWREHGYYHEAGELFRKIIIDEGLLSERIKPAQINIMNMHKAKGKQFDEVFLFEGRHHGGRFVHNEKNITMQDRQKMKVAITRAKKKVTILSPIGNKCPLL